MIRVLLLLWTMQVSAYIPEYDMIASRAAIQHGRGSYKIVQDVTIRKETESFTVRETWYVTGESAMRLVLEGRGPLKGLVSGHFLFLNSTKRFHDGSALRSQKLGDEWLEPLFHFRSSKYFRSRLVALDVAPKESLRDRPPLPIDSDPSTKYTPPSFIRLSRTGGAIAWAIGKNPAEGESPTVWLEQDLFVLRKLKFPGQLILRADNYNKYNERFWYPGERTYEFGGYKVQVNTVKVEPYGGSVKDKIFQVKSLTAKEEVKLPDVEGLKDFYLRYR